MEEIITSSSQRVYKQLGPGHSESTYQKALAHELHIYGLTLDLERALPITYTDSNMNVHYITSDRIDVFIHNNTKYNEGNIILELKANKNKEVQDTEIIQLKKYFRQLEKEKTEYSYGLIINFPQPSSKQNLEVINYIKLTN